MLSPRKLTMRLLKTLTYMLGILTISICAGTMQHNLVFERKAKSKGVYMVYRHSTILGCKTRYLKVPTSETIWPTWKRKAY